MPVSIKIGDWVSPPLAHIRNGHGLTNDELVTEFLAMLFEENDRLERIERGSLREF